MSGRRVVPAAVIAAAVLATACGSTVSAPSGGATAQPGIDLPADDSVGAPAVPDDGSDAQLGTGDTPSTTGSAAPSFTDSPAAGNGRPDTGTATTTTARATGPLTIGVTYIDNSSTSRALGVQDERTVNARASTEALVAGYNARGGMAGRKLRVIAYEWNSQGNNWASDAAAACARFTQDNKVSLVVDNAFGLTGGFRDCLEKAGVVSLSTQNEGDRQRSAHPLHASPSNMNVDRTYAAVLSGMAERGYLKPSHRLGIIIEACPENERAYQRTLRPLIARLGVREPVRHEIDCTTGFASAGPAGSAISGAVLAFRQAQVDRVMFVSYNEAVVLLLFAPAAESQQYRPGYLLSSGAQPHALRPNIPEGQWPQLHGMGNSPYADTDNARPSAADARCLQTGRTAGLTPTTHDDIGTFLFICGPFAMLDTLLTRTSGHAAASVLVDAISNLGTAFAGPGIVGMRTLFSAMRRDGPDLVQPFGYVAACGCMRYVGPAVRAPD